MENISAENTSTNEFEQIFNLEHISEIEGVLWAVTLALVSFLSSYANGVIIIGILRQNKTLSALDVLLGNLALSNWTLAITTFPFVVVSALKHKWIFGEIICHVYGFVTLTLGLTSIFTLLGIAVALHASVINVSYNQSTEFFHSRHRKLIVQFLVGVYILSSSLSACPLIGIGSYGVGKHGFSCTIDWKNHSKISTTFILILMFLGFFVPLIGTVIIYGKIVKSLRDIKQKFSRPEFAAKWNPVQQETLLMGICVTSCFILCWTPYAVTSMWETYGDANLISARVEGGAAFLAKASTALTPIVHLFFNKRHRCWFRRFFCCCCDSTRPKLTCWRSTSLPDDVTEPLHSNEKPANVPVRSRSVQGGLLLYGAFDLKLTLFSKNQVS